MARPQRIRRFRLSCGVLLISGLVVASARLAGAGVANSPLPKLKPGVTTLHKFTVPGVIKNNNVETEFICTSLAAVSMEVAVEVFGAAGGDPLNDVKPGVSNGAQTLLPGATVTIGTNNTRSIHEDEVISLPAASVRNGSARILTTSPYVTCNAFLVDKYGRCSSASIDSTQIGETCSLDDDCGLGSPAGSCEPAARSLAELKLIRAKTQKGD